MNTSKWLPAGTALGLLLLAPTAWAATAASQATRWLIVAGTVSQAGGAKPLSSREEVDSLLAKAHAAIKQGDFQTADKLISQAEKLKVDHSFFYLGDTPKKLRAELNGAERVAKRAGVKRPSEKFVPELPQDQQAQVPPEPSSEKRTLEAPAAGTDPREESPLPLPQTEGKLRELAPPRALSLPAEDPGAAARLPHPNNAAPSPVAENPQTRSQSDLHLLGARRALAVGDLRRATAELESAKQLKLSYGPHADSPERVEGAIRNYRQVMEVLNTRQDSDTGRHQLADALMDQAQELMRWRDYDEAERLVQSIKALRVNYGPFEARPEALMERIAAARRQGNPAAGDPARPAAPGAEQARGAAKPAGPESQPAPPTQYPAAQALYDKNRDATRAKTTSAQTDDAASDEESITPEAAEPLPAPRGKVPGNPKNLT
ncbi:MAG TPA: hypothetical protein VHV08_08265, partial [Pirellulales bacterium]|nr:hypothetical protein [Pirellulales bacterium]